jgi:uncharacterized protein (DUF58 family)
MSAANLVGAGLVLLGAVANAPGLVLLGALGLLTSGLSGLWSRRGLDEVHYERHLANDRAVWGDSVELAVTIENRKLLPLAWLRADDFATDETTVREHALIASDRPGYAILRNVWTLAPFEQVRRRFHLEAAHRGLNRFEWVRLSVADLFGRDAATREEHRPATFLVRPRTVPVRTASGALAPLGSRRARHGLLEDPALFAGVRPFQPGDPRRRLHERATARIGRPVSKRFEPSTARQVVIALDIQTNDDPYWLLTYDEDLVESLAVAAASLARRLLADGAAVGVAVNGWTYSPAHTGFVSARGGARQLTRIADLLGRTSSVASLPFERMIAGLPGRIPSGTLVISVAARDLGPALPALRRLRASGFEVRHVAVGPRSRALAERARRGGIEAVAGHLDPDWRTSDALTLAG